MSPKGCWARPSTCAQDEESKAGTIQELNHSSYAAASKSTMMLDCPMRQIAGG